MRAMSRTESYLRTWTSPSRGPTFSAFLTCSTGAARGCAGVEAKVRSGRSDRNDRRRVLRLVPDGDPDPTAPAECPPPPWPSVGVLSCSLLSAAEKVRARGKPPPPPPPPLLPPSPDPDDDGRLRGSATRACCGGRSPRAGGSDAECGNGGRSTGATGLGWRERSSSDDDPEPDRVNFLRGRGRRGGVDGAGGEVAESAGSNTSDLARRQIDVVSSTLGDFASVSAEVVRNRRRRDSSAEAGRRGSESSLLCGLSTGWRMGGESTETGDVGSGGGMCVRKRMRSARAIDD